MRVLNGATRRVFLIGKYAFKIPLTYSWTTFLNGLLGNMQEREFNELGWSELCPVVWSIPGGWLVVMRRAQPLTYEEWLAFQMSDEWLERPQVPVEQKQCSFGWLNGKIVAVDYG